MKKKSAYSENNNDDATTENTVKDYQNFLSIAPI